MGAGCSSNAGETAEPQQTADCPPRPAYLACDLVGPPVVERIRIGPVDTLLEQAGRFAEAVCQLNDSLNGLLLDVRLATGLLQGGFSLFLTPSPNVDIFSFELLTSAGQTIEVAEAGRLRGRDMTRGGRLAALDTQLAQCLEDLADSFVRNVGVAAASLALSASGTLVPRASGQPPDTLVEAFNHTMLEMRTALGSDYLLALHLHKAQAHGMPAFRVRLLKPLAEQQQQQQQQGQGQGQRLWDAGNTSVAAAAAAAVVGPSGAAPGASPSGFQPATLLDQAACLNASRLADALHGFQDANGRLAAALKKTGLTSPYAVVPISPRSMGLAVMPPTTTTTTSSPNTLARAPHSTSTSAAGGGPRGRQSRQRGGTLRTDADPAVVGAAAVRSLSGPSRRLVARAVEELNGAVHRLAHAAAAAPGPASFAALLTHVLGELRDVVAAAGGERALETYQPSVHFQGGPDPAPSLDFLLDPRLEGLEGRGPGEPTRTGGARQAPVFPDCLSPQVRRAWLLLQELVRVHNSAVGQLESLEQLAGAFEEGLRRRIASISDDAEGARMSTAAAAEATRALLRNHVELRDCWRGALQALSATALLVRDEMAEAAQLARVQCSFMSPMAWSVSIASSAAAMASPGGSTSTSASASATSAFALGGSAAGSVSSSLALSPGLSSLARAGSLSTSPPTGSQAAGGAAAARVGADTGFGSVGDPVSCASPRHLGASVRRRAGGAAKSLADSFAAAAAAATATAVSDDPRGTPQQLGSPPDVMFLQDQMRQAPAPSQLGEAAPLLSMFDTPSTGAVSPSRVVSRATSRVAAGSGGDGGTVAAARPNLRASAASLRSSGTRDSRVGWVPLEARGAGGGGEEAGAPPAASIASPAGQSPTRGGGRPGCPSPGVAAAGAAAAPRGRTGGESLAEEYARAALAHLRLQEL